MNPFSSLDTFQEARSAAFLGAERFAAYLRRLAFVAEDAGLGEIEVSARLTRMAELSIRASKATLLVGPPGTGKTHILRQILQRMAKDGKALGFTREIGARWTTPEEEWTFDRVVLGETVVDGEIRSAEGVLLAAIRNDEWLVLDETNRADMDRVLGGVLTWLSGQRVQIGNWRSPETAGIDVPVYLGWGDQPESEVVDETPNRVEYRAGTDWRLLGTYNAVDAQRVFRMGQALSRRFKQVPVPPISAEEFNSVVGGRVAEDAPRRDEILVRLDGIYRAHLSVADVALGPALFLDIPDYVVLGLENQSADFEELIAEGYVVSIGALLARVDEEVLSELSAAMADQGGIPADSWLWVIRQLGAMRG
ncbi:MAG: AAA family ATPase [Pseudolysinimonas sp.]|uniref:AAA family ATPase n=1 Tax=Pseudolysinimonas sp. TaxID=2680009 RepID=UPI003C7664C2